MSWAAIIVGAVCIYGLVRFLRAAIKAEAEYDASLTPEERRQEAEDRQW